MQSTSLPPKFPLIWAASAGSAYIRPIPTASQIGVNAGFASLTDGFVPLNMTPEGSGGVPPFGQDMNGILQQLSQWSQWVEAGGAIPWDASFSTAVGGYPKSAIVASPTILGQFYMSMVENNVDNPEGTPTGTWRAFQPLSASGQTTSGNIFGLTTGNSVSNPTTAITIQIGSCQDSTNSTPLALAIPITKSLTSVWAAGDGAGGRSTSVALANKQTWHFFLIYNPTTGVTDALFDQSASSPNLPSGFTKFRRIGATYLGVGTAIPIYNQTGDWFRYQNAPQDYVNAINGSLSGPYLRRISVPQGVKVNAQIFYSSNNNAAYGTPASSGISGVHDPDLGVPTGFGGWGQIFFTTSNNLSGRFMATVLTQFTDQAAQVYTQSTDPADQIALSVVAWNDPRGQYYPS